MSCKHTEKFKCFKKVIYQIHKHTIWEVMVVHSICLLPIQKKVKFQTDERLQCCLTTLVESFLFRNEVLLECIDNTSLCNICWNQIHILSNENKELLTDNHGCKCCGNNLCLIDTKSSHKRSLLSTFYPWARDVFISSLFLQIALWRYTEAYNCVNLFAQFETLFPARIIICKFLMAEHFVALIITIMVLLLVPELWKDIMMHNLVFSDEISGEAWMIVR